MTRGVLGLELYEAVDLGPLSVTELALTFPRLAFPVDLSGGVPAFRHRRGRLVRLELVLGLERLAGWVAPHLRSVTQGPAEVRLWGISGGFGVGLSGPGSALAFELLWVPVDAAPRFVVADARGAGLSGPVLAHALRVLDSTLARFGTRSGRVFTLGQALRELLLEVLPAAGARLPDPRGVRAGELLVDGDRVEVAFDEAALPPALPERALRALELAALTRSADDALAEGRIEAARAEYLVALERAPRQPEISRHVAEIDLAHGGRWESALGLLVDAEAAVSSGWVAAELLAALGDRDGARAALTEAMGRESYGPLAARLGLRLAELSEDARSRLAMLDEALARAPALAASRWRRLHARLQGGDVKGAMADAEHLEAAAHGSAAKHAACRQVAAALLDAGYGRQAGRWFERALRYVADDPVATAGLGRAMVAAGRAARGVALLERSLELSERSGQGDPDAALDLARLLADEYRDLPAAIARARTVTAESARVVEARALESRWRAALGDVAGASLAHARTREAIELSPRPNPAWATWLLDAARFEREVQRDLYAAERHLTVALRLAPQDPVIAATFREVAASTARLRRERGAPSLAQDAAAVTGAAVTGVPDRREPNAVAAAEHEVVEAVSGPSGAAAAGVEAMVLALAELDEGPGADEGLDAGRCSEEIERLEGALRGNPDDVETALRLAELLERLGRDTELFALLSARLEDAAEAERARLEPLARAVAERLEVVAEREGHRGEVALYAAFRRRLSSR